jgi:hypothetical protein
MRLLLLIAAFGAATTVAASATEPNARSAYVERRGLVEADARCALFTADVRTALQAGVTQARGALLRAGWSNAQVRELEQAVVAAARARACTDQRTTTAAASARAAFASWVNATAMPFPGWDRTWLASRAPGANGWPLSQSIDAPVAAMFGVRTRNGAQELALVIPLARGQAAPASARLHMRNGARARAQEVSLPQRMAYGLAAGAPAPNAAIAFSSTRAVERVARGGSQAAFVFPQAAFRELMELDPRESVELRIINGRTGQTLFVEVGDIAAARAFLTMPGS